MQHPQPLIHYLLRIYLEGREQPVSNISLAYFATINNEHKFWNMTRQGSIISIKEGDFPEWQEGNRKFIIVQG